MASFKVHTCLIQPGKNQSSPTPINGQELAGDDALFDLLGRIFHSPRDPRDFDVVFRKSADGKQQNEVRNAIIAYQQTQNIETAIKIALRLQASTDRRSGNGLLFLMTGQHATKYRTVISRFPANEGILAEVREEGLDVAFLEQVFIRQLSAYKSILLEDIDPPNQYWGGSCDRSSGG